MRIFFLTIILILFYKFSYTQNFSSILTLEKAKEFFKEHKEIGKHKNEWEFTFIHSDSIFLKKVVNNFKSHQFKTSKIYVTKQEDDPRNKGFVGRYAIGLLINKLYTPKLLFNQYKILLKKAIANDISLIGFQVGYVKEEEQLLREKVKSLNKSFTIYGKIIDRDTKENISFVNIGFFEKNTGTVSNKNGEFELKIPKTLVKDSLTISCLGYETRYIQISNIKSFINIELKKRTYELEEVVVSNKKKKIKILGVKKIKKGMSGYVSGKGGGAEIARYIKNYKKIKIKSISIYIGINKEDDFKLRANIYSVKDKKPFKNILHNPIICSSKIKNGWLNVEIEDTIIIDDDFFIAFEWINEKLQNPLIGLGKGRNNTYQRQISLGKWTKSYDFNWAIKCEASILE